VQLAAEVNWLVDHVRWDLEDDLARVIGDVPAHTMGNGVRARGGALRQFVGDRTAAGRRRRPGQAE
jgi:ubiquinone biosynthesis protein UbiJ